MTTFGANAELLPSRLHSRSPDTHLGRQQFLSDAFHRRHSFQRPLPSTGSAALPGFFCIMSSMESVILTQVWLCNSSVNANAAV